MSLLRRSQPEPSRRQFVNHAEASAYAALNETADRARFADAAFIVEKTLLEQSARPGPERNQDLIDVCLELRSTLSPPVVPGRP
jgi:hypothetical protein